MSDWVITNKYPQEPGYYWAIRRNEYGTYVYDSIIRIRDDMGGCWFRDTVAYMKVDTPDIPDEFVDDECKPQDIISRARCLKGTNGCMVRHK